MNQSEETAPVHVNGVGAAKVGAARPIAKIRPAMTKITRGRRMEDV